MTAFDDLILDQSIRRRVGEPGTVTRPAARSPMAILRDLAERLSGSSVDLLTVTDGIPGHFSLQGSDHQTVVLHQRQVEVCAFLYGLTFKKYEHQLMEAIFEGAALRLIAEFLLQRGHD
jgi:hypothetical protein